MLQQEGCLVQGRTQECPLSLASSPQRTWSRWDGSVCSYLAALLSKATRYLPSFRAADTCLHIYKSASCPKDHLGYSNFVDYEPLYTAFAQYLCLVQAALLSDCTN